MCAFRDAIDLFEEIDADVYGVSVDLPFAQNRWIEELELGSRCHHDHELISKYDVVRDDVYGTIETARRSVFVLDEDGVVTYRWLREGQSPEFDELVDEVHAEVERAT